MSPETLQSLGVLAIGLGFVLIGLGGFSTYHASQEIQHQAELREAEQKGEFNTQLLTLLLKNQQLQQKSDQQTPAGPDAPAPDPAPPSASYYRPPSPPPPTIAAQAPMDTPMAAPVGAPEETPAPAPAPAVAPEPEPIGETPAQPQGSDWREPESIDTPLRYLSGRQRQVIADTLRAHGRHMVKIESSYGDPASQEFAEDLGEAFAEADWMVRGIEPHRGLPLASGVTVSAGSFPPKPETRAVYEALLSAGIPVTQQLDPKQQNAETIILVGTPL